MSEYFAKQPEQEKPNEQLADGAEAQRHLEKLQAEAQEAARENQSIDKLHDQVEAVAKTSAETHIDQPGGGDGGLTMLGTQRELKNQSYDQKMRQIRSHLSAPERSLSKLIHQSTVNDVSEAGSKTIFRASGILGGSVAALLGSLVLLYAAKHYGFRYNYLMFFMLFAGGFVLGLFCELLGRLIARRRA